MIPTLGGDAPAGAHQLQSTSTASSGLNVTQAAPAELNTVVLLAVIGGLGVIGLLGLVLLSRKG